MPAPAGMPGPLGAVTDVPVVLFGIAEPLTDGPPEDGVVVCGISGGAGGMGDGMLMGGLPKPVPFPTPIFCPIAIKAE